MFKERFPRCVREWTQEGKEAPRPMLLGQASFICRWEPPCPDISLPRKLPFCTLSRAASLLPRAGSSADTAGGSSPGAWWPPSKNERAAPSGALTSPRLMLAGACDAPASLCSGKARIRSRKERPNPAPFCRAQHMAHTCKSPPQGFGCLILDMQGFRL